MATAAAGTSTSVSTSLVQFSGQSLDYEVFAQIEADVGFAIKITWPPSSKKKKMKTGSRIRVAQHRSKTRSSTKAG